VSRTGSTPRSTRSARSMRDFSSLALRRRARRKTAPDAHLPAILAGDLLYATLDAFGFSRGTFDARPDDGLRLIDARITNAVHCVPPENKPTPPRSTPAAMLSVHQHPRDAEAARHRGARPHRT